MPDLWPADIAQVANKPPVAILKEQAALLGDKTKNLVTARVVLDEEQSPHAFSYDFFIVAPALQNYHYRLFSIGHNIDLYPVTLYLDEDIRMELKMPREI